MLDWRTAKRREGPAARASVLLLILLAACACGDRRTWEEIHEAAKAAAVDGRLDDAELDFLLAIERSESFDPRDARRVVARNNLGELYEANGRLADAIEVWSEGLRILESQRSENDPEVTRRAIRLARHNRRLGRRDEARRLYEKALAAHSRGEGVVTAGAADVRAELGLVDFADGRYDAARRHFERALMLYEQFLPAGDPKIGAVLSNLGQLLAELGEVDEAEQMLRRAVGVWLIHEGPKSIPVAHANRRLAGLLLARGRTDEAESLYRASQSALESLHPQDHPDLAPNLAALGRIRRAADRLDEAERFYVRAAELLESSPAEAARADLASVLFNLARVYTDQRRFDEAEPLYLRASELLEDALGREHPDYPRVRRAYAEMLRAAGRADEADRLDGGS